MRFLFLIFMAMFLYAHVHGGKHSSEESSEEKILSCGEHEVADCREKEVHCVEPPKPKCKNKCVCAPGYARTYQGHCVPTDQCSPNKVKREVTDCDDSNEVYLYCGSKCPARCGDTPGSRTCTTDCVKGCFCKKGFVLNASNKCVKPENC